jgi:hypothetical protein
MVALVAAMSLALAACGATTTPSAVATGTLTGRVIAGPTCPVERPGHPCPPRPVSATVQAKTYTGRTVASTHTDKDGRYRLKVPVGTYTIVAVTPKPFPRCSPVSVAVSANHETRAGISCDTGIR